MVSVSHWGPWNTSPADKGDHCNALLPLCPSTKAMRGLGFFFCRVAFNYYHLLCLPYLIEWLCHWMQLSTERVYLFLTILCMIIRMKGVRVIQTYFENLEFHSNHCWIWYTVHCKQSPGSLVSIPSRWQSNYKGPREFRLNCTSASYTL